MPSTSPASLQPTSTVLSNGVRVLAKRTSTTPAVSLNLALEAGSAYDPGDEGGLAFLLSRVIDRGTTTRSSEEIAEDLDFRGVSVRIRVTRQLLTLTCDCLVEDFESVLSTVADFIRHPSLQDREIETRRGEVLTAIRQDADNPATTALDRVMRLLYGGTHPYGRPTKGSVESVGWLGQSSLTAYHRARFGPTALSAVIVGDVETAQAVDTVARALEDWESDAGERRVPDPPPTSSTRERVVVPMANKSQADIAYGFTTITRGDPQYHAYWLMSNIFGQYGMGGRLGRNIREREGMAYYAFCGFEAGVIAGPLIVRAGVSGANVDKAVSAIDAEVSAIAADGVTDEELSQSRRYVIGSLPRTLETNAGVAAFLQNVQQFDLGSDYDRRLPGLVESVTREAVSGAARQTLSPERAAVVIAGPYDGDGRSS